MASTWLCLALIYCRRVELSKSTSTKENGSRLPRKRYRILPTPLVLEVFSRRRIGAGVWGLHLIMLLPWMRYFTKGGGLAPTGDTSKVYDHSHTVYSKLIITPIIEFVNIPGVWPEIYLFRTKPSSSGSRLPFKRSLSLPKCRQDSSKSTGQWVRSPGWRA